MPPLKPVDFDDRFDIDELLGPDSEARARFEQSRAIARLGRYIRQAREAVNLTQTALADRIGTTQPHLSEIERGTGPQGPTYGLLLKIAAACGTTVQALVAEPAAAAAPRENDPTIINVDPAIWGRTAQRPLAAAGYWQDQIAALGQPMIEVFAKTLDVAPDPGAIVECLPFWSFNCVLQPGPRKITPYGLKQRLDLMGGLHRATFTTFGALGEAPESFALDEGPVILTTDDPADQK